MPATTVRLPITVETFGYGRGKQYTASVGNLATSEASTLSAAVSAVTEYVTDYVTRWEIPTLVVYGGHAAAVYPVANGRWQSVDSHYGASGCYDTKAEALLRARNHVAQDSAMDDWRNDDHVLGVLRWADSEDPRGHQITHAVASYVAFQRTCSAVGRPQRCDDAASEYERAETDRILSLLAKA